MGTFLIIAMLVLFAFSVPIATSIGIAAALAIYIQGDIPVMVIAQRMFASLDSFPLMAIPFFILAGTLMEVGGISKRLVNLANSMVGHMTGGLAAVAVVTSMFFAAISGSSAATTAAIGSILIPAMVSKGYRRDFAGAVQAASGEIGVIIPPSIPMILYAVVVGVSVGDMFIAGIIPGILIGLSLIVTVYIISKKRGYKGSEKATWGERFKAFKEAFLALLMPFIILGGIYGGIFTPTEAAAVAVGYSFLIGTFVYKEIKWKAVLELFSKSSVTMSIIMIIIANAGVFGWILTREQIPQLVAQWLTSMTQSPIIFLLLVNIFLMIVGMFFETSASIIILAPILTPIAVALGIDPVHFGMIMIVNLAMGMVTPPLGVNLFVACQIGGLKLEQISRALIPFLFTLIIDVLLISYIPKISMILLDLAK